MTDPEIPAQRSSPEHGAGIFRKIIHHVEDYERLVRREGMTFWVADCGAVVVATNRPAEGWPYCPACWTLTPAQLDHYTRTFPEVLPLEPLPVLESAADQEVDEPELVATAGVPA